MRPNPNVLRLKRTFDLGAGLAGTLFFILAYPLLALLIKLESPGPALYSQERIGINQRRKGSRQRKHKATADGQNRRSDDVGGRPFTIYKFRSMRIDAEKEGPQLCIQGRDPRVTRIGWWLRATHLDELPQFWNILKGEMSFIGPRPERAHFTLQFAKSIPHYYQRTLFIKPGLTGLAQITLGYDDSIESVVRKTYYDYSYRASFHGFSSWIRLETWILVNTVLYLIRPPKKPGDVRGLEALMRAKQLPFLAQAAFPSARQNPDSGPGTARIKLHGTKHSIIVTGANPIGPGGSLELNFHGQRELEVNFTAKSQFDLEDLGFLINLIHRIKTIGGKVTLRNPGVKVTRMLQEIHLDKAVEIRRPSRQIMNFLTVDVECWFHAYNLKEKAPASTWHLQETRIAANVEKILHLLKNHESKATFFVLGWVADNFPDIVRMIDAEGHEIGTHGYHHNLITEMTPAQFEEDLVKSLDSLAKVTNQRIIGHRASNFSVVASTLWALEIMARNGLEYDSSIFPIKRDRYGIPGYPNRLPHRLLLKDGKTLQEFPLSTLGVGNKFLPMSGGGYLRLFPHMVTEMFIEMKNRKGHPAMLYFHPWELDTDQRKVNAGMVKSFQHYVNIHTTEWKLNRLLDKFAFTSIRENRDTRRIKHLLRRNPVMIGDKADNHDRYKPNRNIHADRAATRSSLA